MSWLLARSNRTTRYSHIITGSKSQTPTDIQGGLLADDMGMGKTLSMIAIIMSTITDADIHSLGKGWNYDKTNKSLIPCKSTLVVVPSARELGNSFMTLR